MTAHLPQKLRIGLLVDSPMVSKYTLDLAQWGQKHPHLEVSHLIIQNLSPIRKNGPDRIVTLFKKQGAIATLERVGFALLESIESFLLKGTKRNFRPPPVHSLLDYAKHHITTTPTISGSGFVYHYDADAIQAVKNLNLDVLIRCGSGILRGAILHATRFGVLSLHHADSRTNRGGPPAFWEVFLKQDTTGFTIQQLTEELDGGNVLFRGWVATKPFYLLNKAALYEKANFYLKKLLSDIAINGVLPKALESFPYHNPLYKTPNLRVQLLYLCYLMRVALQRLIKRFFFKRSYRWGVAFSFSDWRNLVMWRGVKIKNPPNRFLADPFVIERNNMQYCFVEDYDYGTGKASISAYLLTPKEAERLGEVINEPFHMSYPFLFEYQSRLYMCPETSGNRDIRIYECEQFPLQWRLKQVAMSDVLAVDTTIFEKDGIWWLLTNIDSADSGDYCSELFLYYADNPLTDCWTPHPKNPLLVDASRARNGGFLRDRDKIFRVSQRQGFGRYGKEALINEITHLSKTEYREKVVSKIEPYFFKGIKGTHHLHSNGTVTVFDFVKDTL